MYDKVHPLIFFQIVSSQNCWRRIFKSWRSVERKLLKFHAKHEDVFEIPSSCHSEERSDEESECTKYMFSDSSLMLRMTCTYNAFTAPKLTQNLFKSDFRCHCCQKYVNICIPMISYDNNPYFPCHSLSYIPGFWQRMTRKNKGCCHRKSLGYRYLHISDNNDNENRT